MNFSNFSGDIFVPLPSCDDCLIPLIKTDNGKVLAQDAADSGNIANNESLSGFGRAASARCRRLHLMEICVVPLNDEVE